MERRALIVTGAALMLATQLSAATAAERLTAGEIAGLLSGDTISGTWSGAPYRQYFAADGTAIYVPADGKVDEGRWRVNSGTHEFESWWRSTDWTPYAMVRTDAGGYAWLNGVEMEPFEILSGRQID